MDVGLSVQEGVSNGLTPFIEASKHNVGILWERERGVPNKVRRCTSLQEDRKYFGNANTDMFGPYVARNLYNNAGSFGAVVLGVRIIDATSVVASGTLTDGNNASQALTITNTTPASVGVAPVRRLTPVAPQVGDQFTITSGATTLTFTVVTPTVAATTAGIKAMLDAELLATPAGAFGTTTQKITAVAENGSYVTVTGTSNVAFTFTVATVGGSSNNILKVWAGQLGEKDPGTWGNNLVTKFYPVGHALGVAGKILMEVFYKSIKVESLSAATWAELITVANQSSGYVYLESLNVVPNILDIQTVTCSGGTYVAPVEADFYGAPSSTAPTGLYLFDGQDVQLIACSEFQTLSMAQAGRDYCDTRTAHYVTVLPNLADDTQVATFAASLQSNLRTHISAYNVWAKINDEFGSTIWVPALGHILGAGYIRVPMMQRDQIWTPPAGLDSYFRDCLDITPNPLSQGTINSWVQRYSTNVAVYRQGKGFFLFSSRTYSTNELFSSIHINLMTNFLVDTFNNNMLSVIQKNNGLRLRREAIVALTSFMRPIYNDGGLETTIPFEKACKIICDKSNNPGSQSRKIMNIDVEWIPVECTESVIIRLNRNDGQLIVEAAQV